jgi:L-Ala-D/L-Glu epimerase
MTITHTDIYRLTIPMHPFTIATGSMTSAQNTFIRLHTTDGILGVGECSAFPMIVGETQSTCYEMAKDFAALWKGKNPQEIEERMDELHGYTAFNTTIKSAFDMALFDLAAKTRGLPLYRYLGGKKKEMETDLTIGIAKAAEMAKTALEFKSRGVRIIKVKLGKMVAEDIERIKQIRSAVGDDVILRIDANQGWNYPEAVQALSSMAEFNIEFCEQPMRSWNDPLLPDLKKQSPIKLMADESVFNHHDALRLIEGRGCDFVNIKFAKSGGILEATQINKVCEERGVKCMMGGMLESRLALTAFTHFAMAHHNIVFYDMDTCLLGHKIDPVTGGVTFKGFHLEIENQPGIGADISSNFLETCEKCTV